MGIFGFLKKKPEPPRQKPAAGEEIAQSEKPAVQAPAAFLAVKYNEGGGSFPHMKYTHNFNNFSGYPVSPKNTLLIDVTKPGFDGSMFAPPADLELRAFLKNGEVIDFSMSGYFSLGVLGAHGILKELKREMIQCFDFR